MVIINLKCDATAIVFKFLLLQLFITHGSTLLGAGTLTYLWLLLLLQY